MYVVRCACRHDLPRHGVIAGPFRALSHTRMRKEPTVRRIKRHALLAWVGVTQTASWTGCSTYGWEHCGQTSKHKGECCSRINVIFGMSPCTLSPPVTCVFRILTWTRKVHRSEENQAARTQGIRFGEAPGRESTPPPVCSVLHVLASNTGGELLWVLCICEGTTQYASTSVGFAWQVRTDITLLHGCAP